MQLLRLPGASSRLTFDCKIVVCLSCHQEETHGLAKRARRKRVGRYQSQPSLTRGQPSAASRKTPHVTLDAKFSVNEVLIMWLYVILSLPCKFYPPPNPAVVMSFNAPCVFWPKYVVIIFFIVDPFTYRSYSQRHSRQYSHKFLQCVSSWCWCFTLSILLFVKDPHCPLPCYKPSQGQSQSTKCSHSALRVCVCVCVCVCVNALQYLTNFGSTTFFSLRFNFLSKLFTSMSFHPFDTKTSTENFNSKIQ